MRQMLARGVCALVMVISVGQCYADVYTTPFRKQDWTFDGWGFQLTPAGISCAPTDAKSFAIWTSLPKGMKVRLSATLTPGEATGGRWATAGLGVYADSENYWQLALVQSPPGSGAKRSVELQEMLGGRWLAESDCKTLQNTGAFEWQPGKSYDLTIALGDGQVSGEIKLDGVILYRCTRQLSAAALTCGRPVFEAGGVPVTATDLRADIESPAAETPVALPPFRSASDSLQGGHASGYFHVETLRGTGWLVDPLGRRVFVRGVDWVTIGGINTHYAKIVSSTYPTASSWADAQVARLKSWGFNTLGDGCLVSTYKKGLANTWDLGFGSGFAAIASIVPKTDGEGGFPDVFDSRFAEYCNQRAELNCTSRKSDPWLMGYFLDNELDWYSWKSGPADLGLAYAAWRSPATRACKVALVDFLRRSYKGDIGRLNRDFGSAYTGFDDLLTSTNSGFAAGGEPAQILRSYVALAAHRYFETTTSAIRRYDPNHLILGCRFQRRAPDFVWREAGASCDVVSVNLYPHIDLRGQSAPDVLSELTAAYALCLKPILVSEWSFPARDAVDSRGAVLASTIGAGMRVDNQSQRAQCYRLMQRTLSSLPFVVGSHYFMFQDDPASTSSASAQENCNYGLVDDADVPYSEFVSAVKEANEAAASQHADHHAALQTTRASVGGRGFIVPKTLVSVTQSASGYEIDNGILHLAIDRMKGSIFDTVEFCAEKKSILLGNYAPMLEIVLRQGDEWLKPDRISDITLIRKDPSSVIIDVTTVRSNATSAGFECCCRVEVRAGEPFFRTRLLWIRNTNPWELAVRRYYHLALSSFAPVPKLSRTIDDWTGSDAWRSKDASIEYRVVAANNDGGLSIGFSIDSGGNEHSDCARLIDATIEPGKLWNAPDNGAELLIGGGIPSVASQTVAEWRSLCWREAQ